MSQDVDKLDFSFTWTIENFDMCPQTRDRAVLSPPFVVDALGGRSFEMWLYPRGLNRDNCISFQAVRKPGKPKHDVTVVSTFKIRTTGEPRSTTIITKLDKDDANIVWGVNFCDRAYMFQQKKFYFPGNSLTLQLEFRITGGEDNSNQCTENSAGLEPEGGSGATDASAEKPVSEDCKSSDDSKYESCYLKMYPNECFARTRVNVRKCSVLWPIKIVSLPSHACPLLKPVYFAGDVEASFNLAFYLTGKPGIDQRGNVEIRRKSTRDAPHAFLRSKITVVNSQETMTYHEQEKEHFFQSSDKEKSFRFSSSIKFGELKNHQYFDWTDDVLFLRCQLAFSTEAYCNHLCFKDILTQPRKRLKVDAEPFSSVIEGVFKHAYGEAKYSDVKLLSNGREFSAHKLILSSRSSFFRDMLETDIDGRNSEVIKILDVDTDILCRLLNYLYFDQLEDMSPDDTIKLYKAADKYEVISLKSRCAEVIKSCLTVSSVCDILQLADVHRDSDLMDSVLDFIHLNRNELFCSSDWENWTRSNVHSATEIMLKEWRRKVYRI